MYNIRTYIYNIDCVYNNAIIRSIEQSWELRIMLIIIWCIIHNTWCDMQEFFSSSSSVCTGHSIHNRNQTEWKWPFSLTIQHERNEREREGEEGDYLAFDIALTERNEDETKYLGYFHDLFTLQARITSYIYTFFECSADTQTHDFGGESGTYILFYNIM